MIVKANDALSIYELQARILRVLTNPARLAILDILRDGEHCVCHMEAYLGYRQAFISQHLAVMREATIVQDRREGWNIYYRIADARIIDILDTIQAMAAVPQTKQVRPEVSCPCPHCNPAGPSSAISPVGSDIHRIDIEK